MVSRRGSAFLARGLALLALVVAVVLAILLLFGGSDGHRYTFLFQTGGQLVPGNEVLIAGQPVGTIDSIDLTEDSQAAVEVTLDEPLTEGSTAIVRSTSLSGVANRYISLTMGPDNAEEHPEGATITGEDTTAPVDLDQLFNVFRNKQRESLQKFIEGNATVYADRGKLANRAYKFLNPALNSSERLFAALSNDSVALERFLLEGSRTFGALAERRDDLASLVANGNTALAAIAAENESLDRSLAALPPTLRQANTTFVNLRAALDDLDPLVAASKPATKDLAPFLSRLRSVARASNPVFADLAPVISNPGAANDLNDTLIELPTVKKRGAKALPRAVEAMDASQENIAFLRPYTPDLLAWLAKFGQATAYYDANGHYARVMPAAANVFDFNEVTNELDPIYNDSSQQFDPIDFGIFRRCPGGAVQPAPDGSSPFLDDGRLTGDCDPDDVPPGMP